MPKKSPECKHRVEGNNYIKPCVEPHEAGMHKHVSDLSKVIDINVPKFISYDKATKTMIIQKINGLSVADYYGVDKEAEKFPPQHIFEQVRSVVKKLFDNKIAYPDITGYNFIIDQSDIDEGRADDENSELKLWIIDFEHALDLRFIEDFCDGKIKNDWNPEFA